MRLTGESLRRAIELTTKMVASRDLKVTQQGAQAYVAYSKTGVIERLNIPMLPDNANPEFVRAIQGYIDHEVAHVFYTEPNVQKTERERIGREMGISPDWVHSIFNIVEDTRIERLISQHYRGSEANLNSVRDYVATIIADIVESKGAMDDNTARGVLLPTYMRARTGQRAFIDLMEEVDGDKYFAPIDEAIPDIAHRLSTAQTTADMISIAEDVIHAMLDAKKEEEKSDPEDSDDCDEDPEDGDGDDDADEETKDGENDDETTSHEDDPKDGDDDKKSADKDDGDDEEDHPDGDEQEKESDGVPLGETTDGDDTTDGDSIAPDTGGEEDEGEVVSSTPEDWMEEGQEEYKDIDDQLAEVISKMTAKSYEDASSYDMIDFTRDFDVTRPPNVEKARMQPDFNPQKIEDDVRHTVGALQKEMQRLIAARTRQMKAPGFRSGRLHSSSLHRVISGDDRVFSRKQITRTKKVAVSLLIDCSGSMRSGVGGGKSAMQVAIESAWAFAETLGRIGVVCEVNGFSTNQSSDIAALAKKMGVPLGGFGEKVREEALKFARDIGVSPSNIRTMGNNTLVFKTFEEKFGREPKHRMAAAATNSFRSEMDQNLDCVAVREAVRRLMARPEERKILFVFSDGSPCGQLHPAIECQQLKKEIKKAEQYGVETIGIGIGDSSVKHFYPKNTVVNRVTELPKVVMQHLREVLL